MSPRALCCGLLLAVAGCSGGPPPAEPVDPADHAERVQEWRAWRHEQLVDPEGWLSLAGLYWLEPGENRFGAGPEAELVVESAAAPATIGTFTVGDDGSEVRFVPADGVEVLGDGAPFSGGRVWSRPEADAEDGPETVLLRHGSLAWHVIERNGRLAVRLKDAENPVLIGFDGMDYYPLASEWRLDGRFEAYEPPRTIKVPDVLGGVDDVESPGAAVFELDGAEYRLDLWRDSADPANFFTAFADETNGETTYGGGRFLWIDAPDERGRIEVDFNRSYNPPCAFTAFATCPLPPQQNRLPLRIEAGELDFDQAGG